ncbi:MAG: hypothetical protein ABUL72_06335 [Armatimonadota bacterium]
MLIASIEDIMRVLPGVAVPLIIFMIPVIAILTSHQRKMAELIHGRQNQSNTEPVLQALVVEVQGLRAEVAMLRDQQNQKMIESDGVLSQRVGDASPPQLH